MLNDKKAGTGDHAEGRAGDGYPKALILGCIGEEPTSWERSFYKAVDPLGFILFKRNCRTPGQVKELVGSLRETVGRPDAPVLIDQEGGRVQRLQPPFWRQCPPAALFGDLYKRNRKAAERATYLNSRLIAMELHTLGIDVDCLPVLDVPVAGSHDVIGDRAYGRDPASVTALGEAAAQGLLDGGVLPVMKHLPGHGRATVDSHHDLPRVAAPYESLRENDFPPFTALSHLPWAMTAHVVYEALDPDNPATTSRLILDGLVRKEMKYDGLLISDDLSMKALKGPLSARASAAIAAGCDVALHCNADPKEMEAVADGLGAMGDEAWRRFLKGRALLSRPVGEAGFEATAEELGRLLEAAGSVAS